MKDPQQVEELVSQFIKDGKKKLQVQKRITIERKKKIICLLTFIICFRSLI